MGLRSYSTRTGLGRSLCGAVTECGSCTLRGTARGADVRTLLYLEVMLALRAAFALGVMAIVVWLLRSGQPFGALVVVVGAVWLRQEAESGRLARFGKRFARPT
jgi:hypothetical protein